MTDSDDAARRALPETGAIPAEGEKGMDRKQRGTIGLLLGVLVLTALLSPAAAEGRSASAAPARANPVLDWNRIFVDTLVATNTPNSSSQRLGAIVHTAIFDAHNGIERRYTPLFVDRRAPGRASRQAAVVGA